MRSLFSHTIRKYERRILVSTPSNIAVLKYWGKSDDEYLIPLNPNLSVTLDGLTTSTEIFGSIEYEDHTLNLNGEEVEVTDRLRNLISLAKSGSGEEFNDMFFRIETENNFPTAAGLASSASGLGSISFGLCNLMGNGDERFWSCVARVGSGSACRSMFGGFVKWVIDDEIEDKNLSSYGVPLYDENHWEELRILILIIEGEKKEIPSTLGMTLSRENSAKLKERVRNFVPSALPDLESAIERKDTEKFFSLMIADCESFHDVCLDTTPPLEYRSDVSLRVCDLVREYNDITGSVCCGYTFDAGPNAVLFFDSDEVRDDFRTEYLEKRFVMGEEISETIDTKIGPGPKVISLD